MSTFYDDVKAVLNNARTNAYRAVNFAMVANWSSQALERQVNSLYL